MLKVTMFLVAIVFGAFLGITVTTVVTHDQRVKAQFEATGEIPESPYSIHSCKTDAQTLRVSICTLYDNETEKNFIIIVSINNAGTFMVPK